MVYYTLLVCTTSYFYFLECACIMQLGTRSMLSYLFVTVTLSLLCRQKRTFRINPSIFCSQLNLGSLFLVRLKFDICFASDATNETSHLNFKKLHVEDVTQQYFENINLRTTSKSSEMNTSVVQDTVRKKKLENRDLRTFYASLENFERRLYWTTFTKIAATGAVERRENGMSFVQSGLFLFSALLAVAMETDEVTKSEIQKTIEYNLNDTDITSVLQEVTSWLPQSNASFKFQWVMRLVLKDGLRIENIQQPAEAMKLSIDTLANDENELTSVLNDMVSNDSRGAMKNTFEEEELLNGICAVLLTTLYVRPRWRAHPVVLNGTAEFHDYDNPKKLTRMIRINDEMLYANLEDLDAEAVQIEYETRNLALLMLVPHGNSLRRLASRVTVTNLTDIYRRMEKRRVAVTLPLYTLRMTLLLQNKLEQMGITKLFIPKTSHASDCERFLLSHAVQRIMFWSEAGRHAFKDDGIQWDPTPEKEVFVNRPYLFFVRWKNATLLMGNFVL